jgi:fructose-bisphosphate aldolase class I
MELDSLQKIAKALVAEGKGLLAMDESTGTCNQRFAALGIPQTVEARRAWRGLLIGTPGLGHFISGAILYDETIRQARPDGTPFVSALQEAGILPGIKVDLGAKPLAGFPGDKVTEGLDGLRERLKEYQALGARFAKWRGVVSIGQGGEDRPSRACLQANAHTLARYAALCQEAGMVPIVEPEVVMEGRHDAGRCAEVTEALLQVVFQQLEVQKVVLEGMILKPNMVLAGKDSGQEASPEEAADRTIEVLRRCVPAAVPGVAFLSGGQSPAQASARLNAMNVRHHAGAPWALTFSYSRALQGPAMQAWSGQDSQVSRAQELLLHRALLNAAACQGKYRAEMERQTTAVV